MPAAFVLAPIAVAQPAHPANLSAAIPAQPLADALAEFARQTGLQFVYVSGVVRAQVSQAVAPGLSASDGLTRLLGHTGLRFEYLTPGSVQIVPAETAAPAVVSAKIWPTRDLEEIVVTANRREQNVEDVPITIQVLTGKRLAELNATTFDDFAKYLPGVTVQGSGPALNTIVIRGLSTGSDAVQSAGVKGSFPNVALYLDEQSAQLPNRNLDLYVADIDRIEVLEGPQGTLFGAGAEAGVIRYITNKPKLGVWEANLNLGYATTANGGPSNSIDATFNVPLGSDLAFRGVFYSEQRGGYINNTPATFARAPTDAGSIFSGSGQVPANSVVIDNSGSVGSGINAVTYQGGRIEALYSWNDRWQALLTQSYQNIDSGGVFAEMAIDSQGNALPPLTVQLFNPSYDKDRFENTALTVEGRLADLKLLYAASYLVRNVEQVEDYTSYARGVWTDYYQCVLPAARPATTQCFTPSSTWRDVERNTNQSHELRLTTSDDQRVRGIAGLFYERQRIQEQVDWFYLTALPYFNPIGPPTGYYTLDGSLVLPSGLPVPYYYPGAVFVSSPVTSGNPGVRPLGDAFFVDMERGYTQQAAYGSVDFDLLPKQLTLTVGTRYSTITTSQAGSAVGSFGCQLIYDPSAPNPCVDHSNISNLNSLDLDSRFSGFRSRVNLSWKINDDALLYYTWSQGFRPGGFNRQGGTNSQSPLSPRDGDWQAQARAHGGWIRPLSFAPDYLTNSEVGWKTRWAGPHIQWDGSLYQEDWTHTQIGVFDPATTSSTFFTTNGGNYRVRGIETSLTARPLAGLSVNVAAAWNSSELVKQAPFVWTDGTAIDFASLRTANGQQLANPGGALGSPLAAAPAFQGNVHVRYEFSVRGYNAFAQVGAVHQAHSLSTTDDLRLDLQGNSVAYNLPAFTTYDGALGVSTDTWRVQLYGENLTDTRASLYANYWQWYKAVTVNRPRTLGIRISCRFGR